MKGCPEGTWPVPIGDVPEQDIYREAMEALRFADDYHVVRTALEDVMNGRRTIVIDGVQARIDYPDGGIEHEARMNVAQRLGPDPRDRPPPFTVLALDTPEGESIADAVLSSIVVTGGCTFRYETPDDVGQFFSRLAEGAVFMRELDTGVAVGGYTAGEVQAFYRVLYAKASAHQAYCWASSRRGVIGAGSGSLPLVVTESDLKGALVGSGLLGAEAFEKVLRDLTYDVTLKRTDLFFQPLLSVGAGTYLVAPMVVTASSWERNLQKLWAIKYPKAYSAQVTKKVRLAAGLAKAFEELGFRASATRVLKDGSGSFITDADVAVLDERDGVLALIEVKWFIASSEGYEVRRHDGDLREGATQARAAAEFVTNHPSEALAQLFPWRRTTGCEVRSTPLDCAGPHADHRGGYG